MSGLEIVLTVAAVANAFSLATGLLLEYRDHRRRYKERKAAEAEEGDAEDAQSESELNLLSSTLHRGEHDLKARNLLLERRFKLSKQTMLHEFKIHEQIIEARIEIVATDKSLKFITQHDLEIPYAAQKRLHESTQEAYLKATNALTALQAKLEAPASKNGYKILYPAYPELNDPKERRRKRRRRLLGAASNFKLNLHHRENPFTAYPQPSSSKSQAPPSKPATGRMGLRRTASETAVPGVSDAQLPALADLIAKRWQSSSTPSVARASDDSIGHVETVDSTPSSSRTLIADLASRRPQIAA